MNGESGGELRLVGVWVFSERIFLFPSLVIPSLDHTLISLSIWIITHNIANLGMEIVVVGFALRKVVKLRLLVL